MRPQRREPPLRPGPGTVPALERQPRRPPVLGTATTAARLNRTTTPLNGADLAEVHAGYSRARSQDFRILTIPEHGTVKRGTLGSILRQAGLTPAEFLKLLD